MVLVEHPTVLLTAVTLSWLCGECNAARSAQTPYSEDSSRTLLARRAARAGTEIARGRASPTRSDSAGGNGDVDTEGRHDLGL